MAFPTTFVLDTFTGADETPIATNWTGPATAGNTSANRTNNEFSGGAGFFDAYYNVASYGPDLEIFATINAIPGTGENMDIRAYTADVGGAADGYGVRLDGGASHSGSIRRVDNGSSSTILDLGTLPTFSNGDKLGMARIGNIIEAWAYQSGSWSKLGEVVDATYTSSTTRLVLVLNGASPRWDIFGGGNITAKESDNPPIGFIGRGAGW